MVNRITKKIYGLFLWMAFHWLMASSATSRRRFTFSNKFSEIPGIHSLHSGIYFGKMKGLEPLSGLVYGTSGLGIEHLNHWVIAP